MIINIVSLTDEPIVKDNDIEFVKRSLQNKVEKTAPAKAPVNLPSAPLNSGK